MEMDKIRAYRLCAHHLNEKLPPGSFQTAAGACGLQNSPPGAWETALFNRVKDCSLSSLHNALYQEKSLLQAWSYRGAPVVFPTDESGAFLTALIARKGEQPWIYTRGITAALDFLQMDFDELLPVAAEAVRYLDDHTVRSKETLDQVLSVIAASAFSREKQLLWNSPSMYGAPDRQTVGGAVMSFLLRPCSFLSLVVFARRQDSAPSFTSFRSWTGREPATTAGSEQALVRKYLHCYGPATVSTFSEWLGCSPRQAQRLWNTVAGELEPVQVQGKTHYMLSSDMDALRSAVTGEESLLLLGAHDPYLDMRDRMVILEKKALHKYIWKTVANPGVLLKGGRAAGFWRTKTQKNKTSITVTPFEALNAREQKKLRLLAEEYAVLRETELKAFVIDHI